MLSPGRVFRVVITMMRLTHQFYQIREGLVIDLYYDVRLKELLRHLLKKCSRKTVKCVFTLSCYSQEPSLEVDISCFKYVGEGCSVCKKNRLVEVLGSGSDRACLESCWCG